jgi:hypothetical protein
VAVGHVLVKVRTLAYGGVVVSVIHSPVPVLSRLRVPALASACAALRRRALRTGRGVLAEARVPTPDAGP